ncbi:MAG: ATP-binding cassette domain-containing protein [bacterium]
MTILSFQSISKQFAGVHALREVNLDIQAGEIHALVGENGAGKSTLIKIATGVYQPDTGNLIFKQNEVKWASPNEARRAGIAVIHQESELFPDLTVTENVFFSSEFPRTTIGLIHWKQAYQRCEELAREIQEPISPRTPAQALTAAQRQMTETMSALSLNAALVFMDEPTSSLSIRETETLFNHIRSWKAKGTAIVYVSHRLEEIFAIADRITVLRDGEKVWTRNITEVTQDEIIAAMVGRKTIFPPHKPATPGEEILQLNDLSDAEGRFQKISLTLRRGEITGLYGLVGAGRSELAQAILGTRKLIQGTITLKGKPYVPRSPQHALAQDIAYLPEDRLLQGLFLQQCIRMNASIGGLDQITRYGMISLREEAQIATTVITNYDVRCHSMKQEVRSLSGGNQQKVVFGRWAAMQPQIFILDEPTRGVDVGAKAEIHRIIRVLADQGTAILLISSELPEIIAMSDRILVMRNGQLSGEFSRQNAEQKAILSAALPSDTLEAKSSESDRQHTGTLSARVKHFYYNNRELGIFAFLLMLWLTLWVAAPDFGTLGSLNTLWQNISSILLNSTSLMVAAIGMTLIIAAGGIDISIGSLLALCAVACGTVLMQGWGVLSAILACFAVGIAGGLLNAAATYYGRIHSILTTLGTLSIYRALVIQITGGRWINDLPDTFTLIGRFRLLGIPMPVWIALLCVLLFEIFIRNTLTGRQIFAFGSNPKAAQLAGIPERKIRFLTFGIGGCLTALAAILHSARFGQVQTNMGFGFELDVIAAAVLGGCSIMGGTGSAIGAALGAILLGTIRTTLVALHVSAFYESIVIGALILFAVMIDHILEQKKKSIH